MPVLNSMAESIEWQLRRACLELEQRLSAGEDCSAAQLLALHPVLADDVDSALELIFAEFTLRRQHFQPVSADEMYQRFPQWRARLERMFHVYELIAEEAVPRAPVTSDTVRPNDSRPAYVAAKAPAGQASDDRRVRRIGSYELLEEIARGGMGVVYRARHVALNRVVAIKLILAGEHAGEEHRIRFRREAEAAARLQHPGIVQIFEIGQEGNLPFLVMEYVSGPRLDQILSSRRTEGTVGLAPREAARLVESLARAIQHAHDHGVVHRDLKPANVLLQKSEVGCQKSEGKYSAAPDFRPLISDLFPKIADFGLAKTLSETTAETRTGLLLGTPSYMAPEQAAGRHAEIGPATDVFALGVILYELTTGSLPFQGLSIAKTLEQVRSAEPIGPRHLQRGIPRDLETICLKCLQKEPAKRYRLAEGLAEDLRRFLHDEPIQARPVSRVERALRWCRRNPTVAALGGGIAILLLGGTAVAMTLAVWALNEKGRANKEAQQASISAQQERAARELADHRFSQAEKAVEEYLDGIEKNARLKEADFLDLRKQLLVSAVPFYEEFVKQKPGDQQVKAKRGRAYGRLGLVRNHLGEREEAIADFSQMQSVFDQLVMDFPENAEYRFELAKAHNSLGAVLYHLGQHAAASANYRQALALQEHLVAQAPHVADYRQGLGTSHHNLAILFLSLGKRRDSADEYRRAIDVRQQLVVDFPEANVHLKDLATSQSNLAVVLEKSPEAEHQHRQSLEHRQRLAEKFRTLPEYREELANGHENLGVYFYYLRRRTEAVEQHREALQLRKQLATDFPSIPVYRKELAFSHRNLGDALTAMGKADEAETEHREAVRLLSELAAAFPAVPDYVRELAASHNNLAISLTKAGNWSAAQGHHQQAIAIQTDLVQKFPNVPDYRKGLAAAHYNLAIIFAGIRNFREAEVEHRHAIAIRRSLVADFPDEEEYCRWLAIGLRNLGLTLIQLGEDEEAKTQYLEALQWHTRLVEKSPGDLNHRSGLASTMMNLAQLSRKHHEIEEARRLFRQAVDQQREAIRVHPEVPEFHKDLERYCMHLVEADLALRDHAAAAQTAREVAKIQFDNAASAYSAAGALAHCSRITKNDDPELSLAYAQEAMQCLRDAVHAGFGNAERLKTDRNVAPLRDRADFQQLIQELESALLATSRLDSDESGLKRREGADQPH